MQPSYLILSTRPGGGMALTSEYKDRQDAKRTGSGVVAYVELPSRKKLDTFETEPSRREYSDLRLDLTCGVTSDGVQRITATDMVQALNNIAVGAKLPDPKIKLLVKPSHKTARFVSADEFNYDRTLECEIQSPRSEPESKETEQFLAAVVADTYNDDPIYQRTIGATLRAAIAQQHGHLVHNGNPSKMAYFAQTGDQGQLSLDFSPPAGSSAPAATVSSHPPGAAPSSPASRRGWYGVSHNAKGRALGDFMGIDC